ncbi:type VI secretion system protein TssA [Enterobacillus tribolii]|uniref:Type VI secretion system protein ImpA n=1 Tax=Enterobacillus tribolii TaxID=1487935 RepID=A0A370Q6Z1_9GAMM|nr:type VI secretion system protein TssA [Enterobacillus tribolii]MBW7984911.1 type VI secretion system protein TssA [Enterobacillus tribolii]RDK84123.1 type VI secretion system protein ImpA [Enterobacillus tribolii]
MAIETLLSPIAADNPCGDNLEYDADFQALEKAATGKAEQQFGSTIIPAEAPDWALVERLSTALLARTKDLRVMLYLTRAWCQLRGLTGYADGLELVHQALVRYWEPLLPLLEFDGEADPMFRLNALAGLGDNAALTSSMRAALLLSGPAGEISLRDAGALLDGTKHECPNFPGGKPRLQDELARPDNPAAIQIQRVTQLLAGIRAEVTRHLGESALPEMSGVLRLFDMLSRASQIGAEQPESAPEPAAPAAAAPAAAAQPVMAPVAASAPFSWHGAQVQTRDDVVLMLEKIKEYFRQNEPSHPAPLMIARVQRLVTMDFMQLVSDLAPDGLRQLETILGHSGDGDDEHD